VRGFDAYKLYLSLKLHFTSEKYNYFNYSGASRASQSAFDKRNDKYFFIKLSRKYDEKELRDFYVANLIQDEGQWVGEIARNGEKNYLEHQKRLQSLSYVFKTDALHMKEVCDDFDCLFNCSKGHPPILKLYLKHQICLETLVIMQKIFSYVKDFDVKMTDPVWVSTKLKVVKYEPFLNLDVFKYKKTLREVYL
jgi:hypothetical protein